MKKFVEFLREPVSIGPLVTFRILFGVLLLGSTVRFWYLGWIEDHFIKPVFHFKYYGFEWVKVLSPCMMYGLHAILILAAVGIVLGFWYRLSASVAFLVFTYLELIDLTYYLNHYYFVSLVLLLCIFAPAHRYYSFDALQKKWTPKVKSQSTVSRVWILIFQLQLGITYFYAGIAKLNEEWLFDAMPLKLWLPPHYDMPILGKLFTLQITPYLFAWTGMLYDIFIPFALAYRKTRFWAYLLVIGFHAMTGYLFQIGVFPIVMILLTTIFFSAEKHEKILQWLPTSSFSFQSHKHHRLRNFHLVSKKWFWMLGFYFAFQIIFPFRFIFYEGNMFWTEQGYRFGWRVMLMEKAGSATFYVKNPKTGREGVVNNRDFLNIHQEKQMAMQPDMILQYAQFLKERYISPENPSPVVRAEVYVTLNGRRSQLYFDPQLDLTKIKDSFAEKNWLYPLTE